MHDGDSEVGVIPSTLLIILYDLHDQEDVDFTLRQIEQSLDGQAIDYQIRVIEDEGGSRESSGTPAKRGTKSWVRYVPSVGTGGFAGALKAAMAGPSCSHVVLTNGTADLTPLSSLLPLARRYPVVCGQSLERDDSPLSRSLSWAYGVLSRAVLNTGVRDWDGNACLSIFRKSALAEVLPESDGLFAHTEVLARAAQREIPVAEVGVSCAPGPAGCGALGWRNFLELLGSCLSFGWSRLQFPGKPMETGTRTSWVLGLILAVLSAFMLFPHLDYPLLDPDEGRQAEIPREMLAHHDLVRPRWLGQPYYQKPPLQYWLTVGAYTLFGVHPWSARLVPATAAWLAVLLAYLWACRALGARPAFLGGLVLCLSPGFLYLARMLVLDTLLEACVVAAWLAAHAAVCRPVLRWHWWVSSALTCGLGMLVKGPVALVLLVPPVLAYQCLTPTAARPRWTAWSAYLGLALLVAAPWYVVMALRDPAFVEEFLWRSNVVRFLKPFDHQQPFWFYVPVLFLCVWPWSLLWPALVYFLGSRKAHLAALRSVGLGFCGLAFGWCFVFFSLSGCKSPVYLAPAFIPLSLLLGSCLEVVLFRRLGQQVLYLRHVRGALPRWITLGVFTAIAGCYLATALLRWQEPASALVKMGLTVGAAGLWFCYAWRTRPLIAWGACAAAMLVLVTMAGRDLGMGFATRHSPSEVAHWLRRSGTAVDCPIIAYGRACPSAAFYLRRDCITDWETELLPDLVSYLKQQPKALVLVERGPLLHALLGALPRDMKTTVRLPQREGQVAVVCVDNRPGVNPLPAP